MKLLGVAALLSGFLVALPATPAAAAAGDFSSGFETGQTAPTWSNSTEASAGIGGYCCALTGMESAVRTESAHTGTAALMYSGNDLSATTSYSYQKVFDVDLPVTTGSTLSYWVYPQSGGHLDVAVDLAFTDGTFLRDSGAVDQHGVRLHPSFQGNGSVLAFNTWNNVTSAIGVYAAGKTVDRILIGYDQPANTGTFRGYFDDITIQQNESSGRLSDYVETRRGSDSTSSYSRGNTFPGATVPHGFNFWTPITNGNSDNWLYDWPDTTVQGFGISHEPSPWIADYAQLQVMPMTGAVKSTPDARKSTFSHADEVAKAHYYRTKLSTYGITAEMAPTDHAGVMRFAFPATSEAVILFDTVDSATGSLSVDTANRVISGEITHRNQRMFVYATVDKAITASGTITGQGATSWVRFATGAGEQVSLRMATSFISVAQAHSNLDQEVGTKNLDSVREEAAALWDAQLGTVRIDGASTDRLITFYSNLYRAFMYPNNRSELVGGVRKHQSPYDNQVHDGQMYVNNGFWDTSRAAWPLYTLLTPTRTGEMLDGFVNAYKQSGWTPRWSGPHNVGMMVGSNQDLAFADAYVKGVRNFDYQAAYASMVKNASVYSANNANGRNGTQVSTFKGYVPTDVAGESAAWTLEDANDDFGIAQLGGALGYTEDAAYFRNKALDYANLYSPSVGFFRGKQSNGSWRTSDADFKPELWGCEFTEGAPWHYATPAPQDPQGMANLYGGRAALAAKIDSVFAAPRDYLPGCYGGVIHEMREAYDANLGQYAHSNEPIHHMIYMYNYAGAPAKTQDKIRTVLTTQYGPGPGGGYLGDEDNGQMSAWYVFSALGFYPARMGSTDYTIGAPLHPSATITLENGRTFSVIAPGVSDTNRYIQSAKLNGVTYPKNFLTHADLTAGGTLEFVMGPNPSSWGSAAADLPPSLTTGTGTPAQLTDRATGGTLTVTGENPPSEGKAALTDDTSLTKWLVSATTATLTDRLAGSPAAVKQYTLTSANDAPERDPRSWTLQGSADGVTWTTLDTRSNLDFADRRQTRAFVVPGSPGAYQHYRLQITANHGAPLTQLAEWQLLS
ncbi:GH92 family glycosyl hydrolase [Actinoplanes awajinensis]|uniref:Alpha-1,2-mannosidase n=1 Tax=Actinoplanes awajinensis subsp. mycoplanecinus TaxID=135947 RepID=A0A117MS96_9ACTN|nr:GH92 family glycosyl hydrolase [Actinoplanes awajinensis]KUL33026.1 alpha-1,2-mannosidase [Actinoplanes awajinensis subsp. mycoplanecinus]